MLLLILEAKNNYVKAPILLQKNSKLHIILRKFNTVFQFYMPF